MPEFEHYQRDGVVIQVRVGQRPPAGFEPVAKQAKAPANKRAPRSPRKGGAEHD